MRRTFHLGLLTAALAVAVGCGKSTPSTPPAPTGLDGGWTLVSLEVGGEKVDVAKQPVEERKIRATKDQLIATKGGKDDPLNYKLDPSKTPHEIDLTEALPGGKTKTMYGIYKLEGGTLTICAVESGSAADRPKEFKTEPKGKAMIMTLTKD